MPYEIKTISVFERQAKRLIKKYRSLRAELLHLIEDLAENPQQGTSLGNNCFKIRMAIADKGKGKSGGARVITNVVINEETVYLISIYDKADKENITDKELQELLQYIPT